MQKGQRWFGILAIFVLVIYLLTVSFLVRDHPVFKDVQLAPTPRPTIDPIHVSITQKCLEPEIVNNCEICCPEVSIFGGGELVCGNTCTVQQIYDACVATGILPDCSVCTIDCTPGFE